MLTNIINISYLTAVLALGFVVVRYLYRCIFSPLAHVPGPFSTRFSSLLSRYHAVRGRRVLWIHSLHQKYGPFVRVTPDEVAVADLSATKEIHRVSTPFLKSDWYLGFTGNQPPNMFTFKDPHDHRARRSLLAGPLSENNLKKMEGQVNANILKTVDGIAKEASEKGTADVFKWFTFMASDIIGDLSFAESFQMLDHATPNEYYYDMKCQGALSQYRVELGSLSYLLGFFGIGPFGRIVGSVQRTRAYSSESVSRYEKLVAADPENPKQTLFSKLYSKQNEGQISRDDIIREGEAYIIAGSDTTAVTSTYIVYNVCKTPAVRAKLLQELRTLPDDFGWDDVRPLPYLNNVIQETLRLCGSAPGSLKRDVPPGGATLGNYPLPHGVMVSTQSYSLHRDPSIYTNPDSFDPDRWVDATPEMNHAFTAFGGGTRVCIGMHLARDEMRYVIANLFRRFPDLNVIEGEEAMQQKAYLLMTPKGGRCLIELGQDKRLSEKV